MAEPTATPEQVRRRRWINLGEVVALAALAISALGLWKNWDEADHKATTVVERKAAIPLALRGTIDDNGKVLVITPIERDHALESLTVAVAIKGTPPTAIGNDGRLPASAIESILPNDTKRDGTGSIGVTIDARYVEAGVMRRASAHYRLGYRWVGGGLFGGHSLRLTELVRA